MKMHNKIRVKIKLGSIALLLALIGTFTHCVPENAKEIGDGGGPDQERAPAGDEPEKNLDEGQVINQLQVSTGVKNFEQILNTMGAVTGINPYTNNTIMNTYRQVTASLPTNNDIKLFTSTQQVAITKLAAEFCTALVANQALRNTAWPVLTNTYTQVSSTAFNPQNEALFISQTMSAFWGDMLSEEEVAMATSEIGELIEDIINMENTTAATRRTVKGVCIATLSSAYVTLL